MALVLVRVDCRLIHGQVIEAWVPFTKANCLIVANDDVADDVLQRSIMAMAVPPTVEVVIKKVEDAAQALAGGRWSDKRVILLFANCRDAVTCLRAGLRYDRLNLGNLDCSPGRARINYSVCLDRNDLAYLKEIWGYGIQIEARPVPLDHVHDYQDIITGCQFE
jgi:PTS system mannose-specific IIB component